MERFASLLNSLNSRLTLPQPHKYRVMKELADDLEAYYEYYISKGVSEEEAVRLAENKVDVDNETLRLLIRLNESPLNDVFRHFTVRGRRVIEIVCFIVLAMIIGFPQVMRYMGVDEAKPGIIIWPLTGLALGLSLITVNKTLSIYIMKDHRLDKLHRYMASMLFIGFQCFLLGLAGFFLELRTGFASMPSDFTRVTHVFLMSMQSSLTILIFGTAAALAAGVIWMAFTMRILTIEEQEKAFLFDTEG